MAMVHRHTAARRASAQRIVSPRARQVSQPRTRHSLQSIGLRAALRGHSGLRERWLRTAKLLTTLSVEEAMKKVGYQPAIASSASSTPR